MSPDRNSGSRRPGLQASAGRAGWCCCGEMATSGSWIQPTVRSCSPGTYKNTTPPVIKAFWQWHTHGDITALSTSGAGLNQLFVRRCCGRLPHTPTLKTTNKQDHITLFSVNEIGNLRPVLSGRINEGVDVTAVTMTVSSWARFVCVLLFRYTSTKR